MKKIRVLKDKIKKSYNSIINIHWKTIEDCRLGSAISLRLTVQT